jgi:hypothetical protein
MALCISCNGTTGFELANFYAAARGPSDAVKGQPYRFDLDGQHVTLLSATLHVGALYLTQSVPTSGGGPAPCVLPGTYDGVFVGQVRGGGDIDLLDPSPQPLSVTGEGSTVPAATGQVWLTHGDVNTANDPLPILTITGSVVSNGTARTFSGGLTVNSKDCSTGSGSSSSNALLPGEVQICQARIIQGVHADLTLAQAGTLVLVIDPKLLLLNVDLTQLPVSAGCPTDGCFSCDGNYNKPSGNLLANLQSTGPYRFEWLPP